MPNRNQIKGLKIQESKLRGFAHEHEIEVLVSDNCSEDGSAQYLQEHWSDFAGISLIEENSGFVGNLRNLAKQASGEWIWFFGAGDLPNQCDLSPLIHLLHQTSEDVNTYIDEGVYESLSPFLGGVIYRRSKLLQVIELETDEIWPHVSWSLSIGESHPEAIISKTSLIHIEPWTSTEDWHAVKSTFPFAVSLNALLAQASSRSPNDRRLVSDFNQSQKTLLTWYLQDRMAGKVWGLNANLFQALRLSGSITHFTLLKITAVAISLVPLRILNVLKRLRVVKA